MTRKPQILEANFDWLAYYKMHELTKYLHVAHATGAWIDIMFAGKIERFLYKPDYAGIVRVANGESLAHQDWVVLSRLADMVMRACRAGYKPTDDPQLLLFGKLPKFKKRKLVRKPLPRDTVRADIDISKARTTALYLLFSNPFESRFWIYELSGADIEFRIEKYLVRFQSTEDGNQFRKVQVSGKYGAGSRGFFSSKDYAFLVRIAKNFTDAAFKAYTNVYMSDGKGQPTHTIGRSVNSAQAELFPVLPTVLKQR